MKVMIFPSVCVPDCGSAVLIARQLAAMFRLQGIDTGICADRKSRFSDIAFFESPSTASLRRGSTGTTAEEYLRGRNALSASYLKKDYHAVSRAIHEYNPDFLIEIERPAAIAAAAEYGLPVFSIVSGGAFRFRSFKADILNGLNSFLNELGLEQVLHLRELYRYTQCFAFGADEFLPPFPGYRVASFGVSAIAPVIGPQDRALSIAFTETGISARRMRQIISEAFLGAPYDVYIYDSSQHPGKNGNLHFQNLQRTITINGSRLCIHDGSDALTQYCNALGIPQIILYDDSYQRSWNAVCLERSGVGIAVHESELSMERMYEAYRQILADSRYFDEARRIQENVLERGDAVNMLAYL